MKKHTVPNPNQDIIVIGQVVQDKSLQENLSSKSTNKGQVRHDRENQSCHNGRGPILEKLVIKQISQMPATISPVKIRQKQSQLFTNLEMRN